jgi:hypothetical protein
LALSLAGSGDATGALKIVSGLESALIDAFSPDDRALIWYSALKASEFCGMSNRSSYFKSEVESALVEHGMIVQKLSTLLRPFEDLSVLP